MRANEKYSNEYLQEIAVKHKEHFTSVNHWNEYASENGLPHSQTFIMRFGKWNDIKKSLQMVTQSAHRPKVYDKETLLDILEKNKKHYISISKWNTYAAQNKLPYHDVFAKYIGIEELENLLGHPLRIQQDTLKTIMLRFFPDNPPTARMWDQLATRENLPVAHTYIRHFGSWTKAKTEIYSR